MRYLRLVILCMAVACFGFVVEAQACSTLMRPNTASKLMGKNYVWHLGHGRLFFNRTGMRKKALVEDESLKAKQWVSLYPSLTFNQFAENFPIGGMNSEGFAVEVLLASAEYPTTSEKDVVNELQWVQYLLDTAATVPEAIARAKEVDIIPLGRNRIHYHFCDKTGDCAAAEYIDEKLVISHLKENGVCPLSVTNSQVASRFKAPSLPEDLTFDALDARLLPRMERASTPSNSTKEPSTQNRQSAEAEVRDMYRAMGGAPQWQIVYELANNRVHFKTQLGGHRHHTVAFEDFDKAYDTECKNALFFHKEAESWVVVPPARFDIASRSQKSSVRDEFGRELSGGRITLKRADFSFKTAGATLIEQSEDFLKGTGISNDLLEQLRYYQNTHTFCTDPKNKDSNTPVSRLNNEQTESLVAYFEAQNPKYLVGYSTPLRADTVAAVSKKRSEAPVVASLPSRAETPRLAKATMEPAQGTPEPENQQDRVAQSEHAPQSKEVTSQPKETSPQTARTAPVPPPLPKEETYKVGFRFYYAASEGLRVDGLRNDTGYHNAIQIAHTDPKALDGLWVYVAPIKKELCRVSWPGESKLWSSLSTIPGKRGIVEAPFFLYADQQTGLEANQLHVALKKRDGQTVFNEIIDAPIRVGR